MFFIVETLSAHNYIEEGLQFAGAANNLKNLFPFTFVMISTMMASLMLSDCRRKETRIAVIMLPALSSEKYLSRIMLVLSGIVAGLVIHTVVYYLRVALHFIFQNSAGFMKGAALRSDIFSPIGFADVTINGNKIDTHVLSNLVTGALMSMWLTSCYILGGTIWKKGSWLITSAARVLVRHGRNAQGRPHRGFHPESKHLLRELLNLRDCLAIAHDGQRQPVLLPLQAYAGYAKEALRPHRPAPPHLNTHIPPRQTCNSTKTKQSTYR